MSASDVKALHNGGGEGRGCEVKLATRRQNQWFGRPDQSKSWCCRRCKKECVAMGDFGRDETSSYDEALNNPP